MYWYLRERFLETILYLGCLLMIRITTTAVAETAPTTAPNTIPTNAPVLRPEDELGISAK